jgi:hypothetical protein
MTHTANARQPDLRRFDAIALGLAAGLCVHVALGAYVPIYLLSQPSGTVFAIGFYQVVYVAPTAWALFHFGWRQTAKGFLITSALLLTVSASIISLVYLGLLSA